MNSTKEEEGFVEEGNIDQEDIEGDKENTPKDFIEYDYNGYYILRFFSV